MHPFSVVQSLLKYITEQNEQNKYLNQEIDYKTGHDSLLTFIIWQFLTATDTFKLYTEGTEVTHR